jgi:dTDP-D-glucose 4,6-dehydratase
MAKIVVVTGGAGFIDADLVELLLNNITSPYMII